MFSEEGFIQYWQQTDFSNFTEMDIREEFITRMLYLLGYSKNTINDIIREKSLQLSEPFQRLGRKRISIDYVPSIRLKSFWILEGKPGNPKQMEVGDMLQAYFYAIHPEIQVPYIVLCNGWKVQIFDVYEMRKWNQPIFKINHIDCAEKFSDLQEILSVDTLLNYQRKRLLKQISDTFEVEIDVNQLYKFQNDFSKIKLSLEKKIKQNANQLWKSNFEENIAKADEEVKKLDNNTLIIKMDLLSNGTRRENLEYYRRILKAEPKERTDMLQKLMQQYRGRCHSIFKCNCLEIFINVVINKVQIETSQFMREPSEELEFIIKKNLTYYADNDLQNALCFLDRSCCRIAAIIIKNGLMDKVASQVSRRKKWQAIEEQISQNPSVSKAIIPWIFTFAEYLWLRFSRLNSSIEIWEAIWYLNTFADAIQNGEGIKSYPDNDGDLLGYEYLGDDSDYLVNVTCNILRRNRDRLKLKLSDELLHIIYSDYPERRKYIPKFKKQEYELDNQKQKKYFTYILEAAYRTSHLLSDEGLIK